MYLYNIGRIRKYLTTEATKTQPPTSETIYQEVYARSHILTKQNHSTLEQLLVKMIEHCFSVHSTKELVILKKIFNPAKCKFIYRSLHYSKMPNQINKSPESIVVDAETSL